MSRTIWSTLRTLATSSRVNALSSLDAIVVGEREMWGKVYADAGYSYRESQATCDYMHLPLETGRRGDNATG